MSIFNEILERSKRNKELIGIWKYNDDDGFWCGYVLDYNETLVTIQHFTRYGRPDGIIIVQLEDIQCVDFDDEYVKTLHYVIEHASELEKEAPSPGLFAEGEEWQLQLLQQFEGNHNKIISLDINGSGYCSGFIEKVSASDFILKSIGKLGEEEGTAVYKIEDISNFQIHDLDNRKRLMLYNWRKNKGQ